jgi:hypothetical protein
MALVINELEEEFSFERTQKTHLDRSRGMGRGRMEY